MSGNQAPSAYHSKVSEIGWPRDRYTGPGGGLYTGPGGGLYTGPGGGAYTGPGGGLSVSPGGGLSVSPGGGLYTGACSDHYHSNQPPRAAFLQVLAEMGMQHIVNMLLNSGF